MKLTPLENKEELLKKSPKIVSVEYRTFVKPQLNDFVDFWQELSFFGKVKFIINSVLD